MGDHHYLGKGIHSNSKQQKVSPKKNDNLQICFNCLVWFSFQKLTFLKIIPAGILVVLPEVL